jgi:hypothetical protein
MNNLDRDGFAIVPELQSAKNHIALGRAGKAGSGDRLRTQVQILAESIYQKRSG